jgi:xylulokinase
MPLVVGVDSSTSACKVEIRDADNGRLVGSGRAPHPATTPPRSEQHPHEWKSAFDAAFAAAVHEAGLPGDGRAGVAAISIGGQQHGMVVSDAAGRVLRAAKLWNDTESAPDAAALVHELPGGAAAWATACGSVPVPSFTITKLRWLRRTEPDVFAKVASVMLPHDWLTSQLTGRATTDRGDASGTGYWSPSDETYRLDLLAMVDPTMPWASMLPEVLAPTAAAGVWSGTDVLVAPGTGDNMAAALGLGARPGDLVLSLGTSATAYCVSNRPSADPTGVVAGFADANGRFLPLVCTLNATKVTDAIARLLGVRPDELDALALAAPAGAGGVVMVPHFDGERTPNRPEATGSVVGLRSDVTRDQLARAAIEGVVCNLLAGADELAQWEPTVGTERVMLIGGGAKSAAYRHTVADLTGRSVVLPEGELVALGAAAQAAAALTGAPLADVADAWGLGTGTTVEPDLRVDRTAVRQAYAAAAAHAAP